MDETGATRADSAIVFEEFEEGDPRRGPHFLDMQIHAEAHARAPGRWHLQKRHVDWFAIHLTTGRGYSPREAGRMFGVCARHIRDRAGKEKWIRPMAECDRRELSALVWLAGVKRLSPDDVEGRNALKTASEWRPKQAATHPVWREKDQQGERVTFTINEEIPYDAYFSDADPKRDERRSVMDNLEAELRELEAQWEEEDEEEEEEPEEDESQTQDGCAEAPDQVGEVSGGLGEPVGGAAGVAGVGAPEPAPS